ncbi:MAG: hypothetical protein LBM96_12495 [Methanobrevibacter sp.]|jgi:Cdc6-like AAA superfamily ATPase|nr:hypothetical protein [Candidatus Methanoflexus mossambicus]
MYTLLRVHEINRDVETSVITMTNRKYINFVLNQTADTMFNPIEINFEAYELE